MHMHFDVLMSWKERRFYFVEYFSNSLNVKIKSIRSTHSFLPWVLTWFSPFFSLHWRFATRSEQLCEMLFGIVSYCECASAAVTAAITKAEDAPHARFRRHSCCSLCPPRHAAVNAQPAWWRPRFANRRRGVATTVRLRGARETPCRGRIGPTRSLPCWA